MATSPSGKARVCKTLIRRFKSARRLLNKVPIIKAAMGLRDFERPLAAFISVATICAKRYLASPATPCGMSVESFSPAITSKLSRAASSAGSFDQY